MKALGGGEGYLRLTPVPTGNPSPNLCKQAQYTRAIFGGIVLWFVVESLGGEGRCYLYLL